MKKIVHISIYVFVAAAIIALTAFSGKSHRARLCPGVEINIDYGSREKATDILLVLNDVKQTISLNFDSLKGRPLSEINIEKLEKVLSEMHYSDKAEAFAEVNGKVHISLKHRRPVVRIYGMSGYSFYIDETGTIIPVRYGFPARVMIASGVIDDRFYKGENINIFDSSSDTIAGMELIRNIFRLATLVDNDKFLKKEITQINISGDGTITMIPLVGRHTIEMLSFDNMDRKLRKLKIFYKKGLRHSGWGKYRKINIEYKDQIVCTKI